MFPSIDSQILDLRRAFLNSVPARMIEIHETSSRALGTGDETAHARLRRQLRSFAGMAAAHGLNASADLASQVLGLCDAQPADEALKLAMLLEDLTASARIEVEPARIVTLDARAAGFESAGAILQDAGYDVTCTRDDAEFRRVLAARPPDVVVLDERKDGIEMTRALRALSFLESTPIIHLSAESSAELQMALIAAGADDVIARPVEREQLIATICARLNRSRIFRSLIDHDELTGLQTGDGFRQQLQRAAAESARNGTEFCLVTIDVDRLREINQRYGAGVGDRTLTGLAQYVRGRIRSYDQIARTGGDEFGILLRGACEEEGARLAQRLLDGLADAPELSILFKTAPITFSAGVAALQRGESVYAWWKRSAAALQIAQKRRSARVTAA